MPISLGYILALAAKAFLEAAHIPFNGTLPAPSMISSTTALPTSLSSIAATSSLVAPSSPSPSPATATASAASTASTTTTTPTIPIPRNFRLQILSPNTNPDWNAQPLTAYSSLTFTIGGPTSQTCNTTATPNCATFDHSTTFTIANGYAQLYNGASLPQIVYINPTTGALKYVGSSALAVPNSALRTGLVVRQRNDGSYLFVYNDGQDRNWMGCSQGPGTASYVGVDIGAECESQSGMSSGKGIGVGIGIQAIPVDGPGAWAYGPPVPPSSGE